jgi:hypothetical protein
MKKHLFIIISIFLLATNANVASGYNNALHEVNSLAFGLQSSAYSNSGILDGSPELSRIGRTIVHKGHKKFWNHPATQNGITALTWIVPIGKGITFLSNIIRIGAKLITKQAVKEGGKAFFEGAKYSPKVLEQMKRVKDLQHAFPKSVDGYATKFGKWSTKIGGDGSIYQWLKMPGNYGGKTGVFEYTKDANGLINHRFFNVP